MPFWLCNAAKDCVDKVVPSELKDWVFIYQDDLLVVSSNIDIYMQLLRNCSAGLTINMHKSILCYRELKYLAYIVGGGKIKPDEGKKQRYWI